MDLSESERAARHTSNAQWDAMLRLEYARREQNTVLSRREHRGPLRVLRNLYPEGSDLCHTIVVHPPGGIAGGDRLTIDVALDDAACALLTTPGAGKWYRCDDVAAAQTLNFTVGPGASLEWLPQETILFDGTHAALASRVQLAKEASYLGWEILCFGRQASGESFTRARLRLDNEIWQEGHCLWREHARLTADDPLLSSPVGLKGKRVCATLVAAGRDIPADILAACREVAPGDDAIAGITRLPPLLIARWLGDSGEEAKNYFEKLWALLRPAVNGRDAAAPRIWAT